MTFFEAYDAILALGATSERATRVAEMRREFERRTGEFVPEDAWFEARSRAFWDDAVTTQGFAREVEAGLPADATPWITRLERAHRGLFVTASSSTRADPVLRDLWGGAELVVHTVDDAMRDALAAAVAPFDARLVGSDDPPRVALLPGAVFHPAEAAEPIAAVLKHARAEERSGDDVLDALLRMERGFRASARVKASYAYRADRLGPRRAG
ncbi:MAG: hypothetical protein ACLQVI_36845 [Polyangiaceae bacterium]|jgi:hypothetical protein